MRKGGQCRGYGRVGRVGSAVQGVWKGWKGGQCRGYGRVGRGGGQSPICLLNEQLRDFSTFSTNGNAQKRSNFVVRYALEFNTKTFLKSRFQHNVK